MKIITGNSRTVDSEQLVARAIGLVNSQEHVKSVVNELMIKAAGYATAALKHDLKLDVPALAVKDGVITLPVADINRPISFRMNHVKMAAWREQKNEAKSAKKLSKL